MSMRKILPGTLLSCLVVATFVNAEEKPLLGKPADAATIAAVDFVVMTDGEGLPRGSGNALRGEQVYVESCLACHGAQGRSGVSDVLVGGHGTLTSSVPNKTVGSYWPYATTLFDYIRRAMPYPAPGSLTDDEVYSVTAYILFLNGIIAEGETLSADTLAAIQMPNRDNFVWAYTPK